MEIYAIEITSECNIRCSYCPQPDMARKKEHMSLDMFERILDYPMLFDGVAGHLFGEAFLHPDLLEMTRLCDLKRIKFGFSTNTLGLDMAYLEKLIDAGLGWLVISYHIPQAPRIKDQIQKLFPNFPVFTNQLEVKHDWAAQVDANSKANVKKGVSPRRALEGDCVFHEFDLVTISAQGDIFACCVDAEGVSNMGSLFQYTPEEFAALGNDRWFSLCDNCHERNSKEGLQAHIEILKGMADRVESYKAMDPFAKQSRYVISDT